MEREEITKFVSALREVKDLEELKSRQKVLAERIADNDEKVRFLYETDELIVRKQIQQDQKKLFNE